VFPYQTENQSLTTKSNWSSLSRMVFIRQLLNEKIAASGMYGLRVMLLAFELIITLMLGFVLGRIWQIRQQIVLSERAPRRSYKRSTASQERPLPNAPKFFNDARPISPASNGRQSTAGRRLPNAA
jgi:hypothetical protein